MDFNKDDEFKKYLQRLEDKKPLRHDSYEDAVKHSKDMRIHILGEDPEERLQRYRPNEPKEIQEYRNSIYEPITKSSAKKVINTISKITKSSNFTITHPQKIDSKIQESETLEKYTEENYPLYGKLTKYLFNKLFKHDLYDPNAIAVIMPLEPTNEDSELYKPVIKVYRADQVVDFIHSEYYTVLLDEKNIYNVGTVEKEGNIYRIITKDFIYLAKQTGEKEGKPVFDVSNEYTVPFGETPVFFLGGEDCSESDNILYESFIEGILPYWNTVIDINSDLRAQFVQHLYLERIEMEIECDAGCQNNAKLGYHGHTDDDGNCKKCKKCGGSGWINGRSPYGVTKVKQLTNLQPGEQQIFPGVEYPSKPVDIVQIVIDYVESQIDKGFSAVNMDFLSTVGLGQSGVAKSYDRNEFNDFMSTISDNLFDNIVYKSYYYINNWRYWLLFNGDKEKLKENMPIINKPTTFDTLTIGEASQELMDLRNAGVNEETIGYLEKDLIDKRFANDPEKKNVLQAMLDLDPFINKTEDDKMVMRNNGGIEETDYIISCYIKPFILRAWEENDSFFDLEISEQLVILKKYADEKKNSITNVQLIDNGKVL